MGSQKTHIWEQQWKALRCYLKYNFCDSDVDLLTLGKLKKRKKSDTVFFLGAGASMLDITDEQWEIISNADSVGFNNWSMHPFVPSLMYTIEVGAMFYNLAKRSADYGDLPIVFRPRNLSDNIDFYKEHRNKIANLHLALPHELQSNDNENFCEELTKIKPLLKVPYVFFNKATTMDWLLMMSVRLGYKRIVFLGVDAPAPAYFYDTPTAFAEEKGLRKPYSGQHITTHATADPEWNKGRLMMDDIIANVQKCYNPNGDKFQLYVGNPNCFLAKHIPVYEWD